MEKTTFCRFVFVFSKQKKKRRVSGSSFWFENEIVDVVLSNCFWKRNETKFQAKHFFFNDEKMFIKSNFFGRKCCIEMFYHVGCNIDCKKKKNQQKHGPSNPKKVHFNLIIISFWLFKDCGAKLITVFCQTINILYKCNYLFTGIFYESSKGS